MRLVAPYGAIPRDYLSDTPLLRAMGLFHVSSTWPIGCDTPSLFLSVSPLESMLLWGCDTPPPPQKGYLNDTCAIPHENNAKRVRYPLCDTISKRYCAISGVSLYWAAKDMRSGVNRFYGVPQPIFVWGHSRTLAIHCHFRKGISNIEHGKMIRLSSRYCLQQACASIV